MSTLSDELTKSSVVLDRELDEEKSREPSGPSIRCPLCGWSPRKDDRWYCDCGHVWNTFDTGGVCPACVSTGGPKQSASLVPAGRYILTGICTDKSLAAAVSGSEDYAED